MTFVTTANNTPIDTPINTPGNTAKNTCFILRARAAPTQSHTLLGQIGHGAHCEILAHTLMNAFFFAQGHRDNVVVHLVLESTQDYSRTITIDGAALSNIGGFHEQAWLAIIAQSLDISQGMAKEQLRLVKPGVQVRTLSFERLVLEVSEQYQLYVMDKKGEPLEDMDLAENSCFILTDHIPMPKKSFNSLKRLGAEKVSLGPKMLFASQCVVLIHNTLDKY